MCLSIVNVCHNGAKCVRVAREGRSYFEWIRGEGSVWPCKVYYMQEPKQLCPLKEYRFKPDLNEACEDCLIASMGGLVLQKFPTPYPRSNNQLTTNPNPTLTADMKELRETYQEANKKYSAQKNHSLDFTGFRRGKVINPIAKRTDFNKENFNAARSNHAATIGVIDLKTGGRRDQIGGGAFNAPAGNAPTGPAPGTLPPNIGSQASGSGSGPQAPGSGMPNVQTDGAAPFTMPANAYADLQDTLSKKGGRVPQVPMSFRPSSRTGPVDQRSRTGTPTLQPTNDLRYVMTPDGQNIGIWSEEVNIAAAKLTPAQRQWVCGELRTSDVPLNFAQQLRQLYRSRQPQVC